MKRYYNSISRQSGIVHKDKAMRQLDLDLWEMNWLVAAARESTNSIIFSLWEWEKRDWIVWFPLAARPLFKNLWFLMKAGGGASHSLSISFQFLQLLKKWKKWKEWAQWAPQLNQQTHQSQMKILFILLIDWVLLKSCSSHSTSFQLFISRSGRRELEWVDGLAAAAERPWCSAQFDCFHCAAEVHSINKLIPLPSLLSLSNLTSLILQWINNSIPWNQQSESWFHWSWVDLLSCLVFQYLINSKATINFTLLNLCYALS